MDYELTIEDLKVLCKPSMYHCVLHYLSTWLDYPDLEVCNIEECYNLLTYLYRYWNSYLNDMFSGIHLYDNVTDLVVTDLIDNGLLVE